MRLSVYLAYPFALTIDTTCGGKPNDDEDNDKDTATIGPTVEAKADTKRPAINEWKSKAKEQANDNSRTADC
jgi:hypothetical protein